MLTDPYCPHVLFFSSGMAAHLSLYPLRRIPQRFRGWDYVERRRNCSAFFEVANPQLAPGKLPFDIGPFLNDTLFVKTV